MPKPRAADGPGPPQAEPAAEPAAEGGGGGGDPDERPTARPIRVLIADDQAVVRLGFRAVLETAPDIETVGEAADGIEAAQLADALRPDVVLMDVRMPGCDGLEATARIAGLDPPVRVLVVTNFDIEDHVRVALRAGASGFVLKDVDPQELLDAVRAVSSGQHVLAPAVTARLVGNGERDPGGPGPVEPVTGRERDVLACVARGMSNAEIAERIHVAETTVKTHVSHLLRKLALRDRVQLTVYAFENGLAAPLPG